MDRLKFFKIVGKSVLLTSLLSIIPIKLFGFKDTKNIQIKIHPSAVKRESKD